MDDRIDIALQHAAHGMRVFPLLPGKKTPHGRLAPHGCKTATTDPATIAGWWQDEPTANIGIATGRGLVVIDIDVHDDVDGFATISHLEETIGQLPHTLCSRTPSGGAHVYLHYPPDVTVKNTAANLGTGIDTRGEGGYVVGHGSVCSAGKWAYTDCYMEPAEIPKKWLEIVRHTPKELGSTVTSSTAWGAVRLERCTQIVCCARLGARNHTLNKMAYKVGQGIAGDQIDESEAKGRLVGAAMMAGLPESEARKTTDSGIAAGMKSPKKPADLHVVVSNKDRDIEPGWRDYLPRTNKGEIKSVAVTAKIIASNRPEIGAALATNERSGVVYWVRQPPFGGDCRPLGDNDGIRIAEWIYEHEGVALSADIVYSAALAVGEENKYDPVKDYLTSIKWDGTPRISGLFFDYFCSKSLRQGDTDYARAIGTAWMIAAVARVFDPGCQVDNILVIEGEQGIKKSTGLATLGGEWYADLAIDVTSKDCLMSLHGPWLCEWSELSGHSRRESEAVKAFLTRREDHVRPPYGRATVRLPRRCVFAATTNDRDYLIDSTGNRRYWPIAVDTVHVDRIADDRDELWAEAVACYRRGEHWWLPRAIEVVAIGRQAERLEIDTWEETIADALTHGVLQARDFVTTGEIVETLSLPASAQHAGVGRRISRIMRRIGWSRGRRMLDSSYARGYSRPS